MQAYKFIDPKFATFLDSGEILVGTLRGFGDIEGLGHDSDEGQITRVLDQFSLTGSNKDHNDIDLMRSMGMHVDDDNASIITIVNARQITVLQNIFCVCFTTDHIKSKFATSEGMVGFRVNGLHTLARELCEANPEKLAGYKIGRVNYKNLELDARSTLRAFPSPFEKALHFSDEIEVRIIFRPRFDGEIEPFVSKPNIHVAHLFQRLE